MRRHALLTALFLAVLTGCGDETATAPESGPGPLAKALQAKVEESAGMIPPDVMKLFEKAGAELQASGLIDRATNVGGTAPDFELKDGAGMPVSLASLRQKGPVVVAFYRGKW